MNGTITSLSLADDIVVQGDILIGNSSNSTVSFNGSFTENVLIFGGEFKNSFTTKMNVGWNMPNTTKDVVLQTTLPDASGMILTTGNLHRIDGKNATFVNISNNLNVYTSVDLGISGNSTTFLGETTMNGDVVLGSNQQNDIVLNGDFKAIQLIFGRKFNNSMKYQSLNMALAMASNSTFTLPSIAYYHFNISSITSNGLVTLTEVMIDVTSINKNNVVFTKNTGDLVNDDVVIVSNCASFTNDIYKVTNLIANTEFQLATTDDTVLEDNSDLEGSLVRDANALLTSTTGLSATHNAGIYYN
eukprot:g4708.t1